MATNTLEGSTKNREMEKVLLDVIKVLEDSQKGFADIGEHLKDEQLKRYFLAESLKRASFRAELENELHRAGMHDVKETGSVAGALHRTWGDLKATTRCWRQPSRVRTWRRRLTRRRSRKSCRCRFANFWPPSKPTF
jgi:hypothetical protein